MLHFKGRSILSLTYTEMGLPWQLSNKESACKSGATGNAVLILGWGRSPGGGHSNPPQALLPGESCYAQVAKSPNDHQGADIRCKSKRVFITKLKLGLPPIARQQLQGGALSSGLHCLYRVLSHEKFKKRESPGLIGHLLVKGQVLSSDWFSFSRG